MIKIFAGISLVLSVFVISLPAFSQPIRAGNVGLTSDAGLFIGVEKGYFKEEGIDLKLERFRTAGDMMAPLATGELPVATGGIGAGMFNGIARGMPIIIVADKGSTPPGRGFLSLMVRKDLWDKGEVRSAKDLKGRPVASNAPAITTGYQIAKALEKEGLKISDVDLKFIAFPLMVTALETGAIDAALIGEPFATLAEEKKAAVRMLTADKIVPNTQIAVIFYNKEWGAKNPEPARRFMNGYIKSLRYYNDALREKGGKLEELISILIKHTPVKERPIYDKMVWPGLNPDGYVDKETMADQQRFFAEQGQVPKVVDMKNVVDDSFVDAALRTLGRYGAR